MIILSKLLILGLLRALSSMKKALRKR